MVIAIDGYSSSGKSTLAKDLAKALGFIYVDTGAMYRAITYYFIKNSPNFEDNHILGEHLPKIELTFRNEGGDNRIFLNGDDVSAIIRTLEVSSKVSEVAAMPSVRKKLVAIQQSMASQNLVMDGRDIGTVVFPAAEVKFFVNADVNERSKRRHLELTKKGDNVSLDEILSNLMHRDLIDTTRATSPLIQAEDAITIDTTHLSREAQLEFALDVVKNKLA